MQFEFATAERIVFGPGKIKELIPAAASFGKRALFVMGRSGERAAPWIEGLRSAGLEVGEFHVSGEPTVGTVVAGLKQARSVQCDLVISMGGGSVIDAGKAIAALMANPGEVLDYLEVVGKGQALQNRSLPYIAIPTTAGTGSEVTRNAVLGVPEKRVKVSLRSPLMLPRLAIVDPELTYGLPQAVTATSGLDALAQLIEPFLSVASNPMTDAVCREGIRRVARSLRHVYENGDDKQAREDMSVAALFGGMALANAKLGAVHGFAGPIGGMFPAAHGAICARLLPAVMQVNLDALRQRAANSATLKRFDEVTFLLTREQERRPEDGIRWLQELCSALQIAPLASYGMTQADFPEVVARAKKANSMKGNPVELNDGELAKIVEMAF